ncbi:MAG: hypothetical protein HFJ12_05055 [Bacilli bacterium]|nr:hypothetical protein [Bacilli bacterium]
MSKKISKKRKQKRAIKNDGLLLAMLLSTVSILAVALKDYSFYLGGLQITFAVFVIPIILFVSNYITKKYGFKTSLQSILVSSLIIVAFIILIKDLVNQKIILIELVGHFVSYFVSLFINLSIYYYILINFRENQFLIYFDYIFSIVIHHMLYLLFLYHMVITDRFWNHYFGAIAIQGILAIALVMIDKKIERGIKKEKAR